MSETLETLTARLDEIKVTENQLFQETLEIENKIEDLKNRHNFKNFVPGEVYIREQERSIWIHKIISFNPDDLENAVVYATLMVSETTITEGLGATTSLAIASNEFKQVDAKLWDEVKDCLTNTAYFLMGKFKS